MPQKEEEDTRHVRKKGYHLWTRSEKEEKQRDQHQTLPPLSKWRPKFSTLLSDGSSVQALTSSNSLLSLPLRPCPLLLLPHWSLPLQGGRFRIADENTSRAQLRTDAVACFPAESGRRGGPEIAGLQDFTMLLLLLFLQEQRLVNDRAGPFWVLIVSDIGSTMP